MTKGAIAIFVKTPGFSPLKTRLAVHLGKPNAEAFHLLSTRCVTSVVQAVSQYYPVQGYYAVAEEQAVEQCYWQDLPALWQGQGGLGEKMATIYQTLLDKHPFVILVGADIPQMSVDNIMDAIKLLAKQDASPFVLAPSDDGGFWLFGGSRLVPLSIWKNVDYSQEDTGLQFINAVSTLGSVKTLTCLRDIDQWDDLQSLAKTLPTLTDLTSTQQALITFIQSLEN